MCHWYYELHTKLGEEKYPTGKPFLFSYASFFLFSNRVCSRFDFFRSQTTFIYYYGGAIRNVIIFWHQWTIIEILDMKNNGSPSSMGILGGVTLGRGWTMKAVTGWRPEANCIRTSCPKKKNEWNPHYAYAQCSWLDWREKLIDRVLLLQKNSKGEREEIMRQWHPWRNENACTSIHSLDRILSGKEEKEVRRKAHGRRMAERKGVEVSVGQGTASLGAEDEVEPRGGRLRAPWRGTDRRGAGNR